MIDELAASLRAQVGKARKVKDLPEEWLHYHPEGSTWNVLEVFAHMVLSGSIYERGLRQVFNKKADALPNAPNFRPGLLGQWFTSGMRPKADGRIAWKTKTLKIFDPAKQQGASLQSIDAFIDLCTSMLDLLERARHTDLGRMKVVSSLGPIIRFKAGDAFRFTVAHQERHFLQIERILAAARAGSRIGPYMAGAH
jgi:hypothetical protein